MIISSLLNSSTRHPGSEFVLVEGEINGNFGGTPLLIAPFHIHQSDEEIFFVLSGEPGFIVGDDEFVVRAGDAVLVPPGAVHTWWAVFETPVRYLITMQH